MFNGEPDKIPYEEFCIAATTAEDLEFNTNGERIQCKEIYKQPYGNDGGNLRRVTRGATMTQSEPPVVVSKEPHKSAEAEGYATDNNEVNKAASFVINGGNNRNREK